MITKNKNNIVGLPKTQFGTRLCHRIICEHCQKVDYVSIKTDKAKFCRPCAEKILKKYELGKKIPKNEKKQKCPQCATFFYVEEELALKKEDILCKDCFKGFLVWRGKSSAHAHKNSTLLFSQNKTVIRKKNYERI